ITGGGLLENVPRILRKGLAAELHRDAWTMPELFRWLQREGRVADHEMARVFNCGIGMVLVAAPEHAEALADTLRAQGETVYSLGTIVAQAEGGAQTSVI